MGNSCDVVPKPAQLSQLWKSEIKKWAFSEARSPWESFVFSNEKALDHFVSKRSDLCVWQLPPRAQAPNWGIWAQEAPEKGQHARSCNEWWQGASSQLAWQLNEWQELPLVPCPPPSFPHPQSQAWVGELDLDARVGPTPQVQGDPELSEEPPGLKRTLVQGDEVATIPKPKSIGLQHLDACGTEGLCDLPHQCQPS